MSQKKLADYLGLSPATVSLVINRSAVADSIPQETKERIFAAARKFNYRPNFFARSVRTQRSFTIGVMVPEVSEGYAALVLSGMGRSGGRSILVGVSKAEAKTTRPYRMGARAKAAATWASALAASS